eukprot:2145215-Rhodomonas_salina.1
MNRHIFNNNTPEGVFDSVPRVPGYPGTSGYRGRIPRPTQVPRVPGRNSYPGTRCHGGINTRYQGGILEGGRRCYNIKTNCFAIPGCDSTTTTSSSTTPR